MRQLRAPNKHLLAVLLAAAVLAVPALAAADDWPMFQHDERHTGVSQDSKISVPMGQAWTFATNGPIRVQPVVKDGVVYFGSCDQKFYAVSAATGELRWRYFTDGEVMSTAAVGDDGAVYFGCDDGYVYALDAKSGELKWKSPVRRTPPPPVPASRYIKSEQPLIPPWSADGPMAIAGFAKLTHQVVRSPVLVAGGMVFVGTGLPGSWGHLHGFDAKTGRLCWTRPSSVQGTYRVFGGVENGPVMYRGTLFWPEYLIEALDPYSGRAVPGWPEPLLYRVGSGAFSFSSQIAVSPEGLAVAFVYARHYPHSGHPAKWQVVDLFDNSIRFAERMGGTRPQLEQSPIVNGSKIYFVLMEAKTKSHPALACYDLLTGKWLAGFDQPDGRPFNGCLALAGETLFGVTQDGIIYAFKVGAAGGELEKIWTHDLKTAVFASGAIAGGTYFIGAEDGKLYALLKESGK